MKRFFSTFFLLIFITLLIVDSVSHHNHDETDKKGIVKYENFKDCKLCLFNNLSSNSYSNNELNASSLIHRFDIHISIYELDVYSKSFNHSLSLRGPPHIS